MVADDALLRRYLASREEAAFAELVHRHIDGVYSAALRRLGGDAHLAQDVTQQVFVALNRQAQSLTSHPSITGWLFTTTRHFAANTVRAERRRRLREQEAHAMHVPSDPDPSATRWSDLAPVLDATLDQLKERDRAVILLRFVDQRTYPEIATLLDLSEDAARMRLERALEKLRSLLTRSVSNRPVSAAALATLLAQHVTAAAPAGLASTVTGAASLAAVATLSPFALCIQLMTTSKLAGSAAAALVMVAALGTTAHLAQENRSSIAALAVAQADLAALQQRQRSLEGDAERAAAARASAVAQSQAARAAQEKAAAARAAAASAATPLSAGAVDTRKAGDAFLARNPAVKQALRDYHLGMIRARFGALIAQLNLSPEQTAAFENLLLSQRSFGRELTPGGGYLHLTACDESLTPAEMNARLPDVIGADGMRAYNNLLGQQPAFLLTSQLSGALALTDVPLHASQAQPLVEALTRARRSDPGSIGFDWDAAMANAAPLLLPAQLSALRNLRALTEYQEAVNQIAQTSADAPAAPEKS